jgi:hypothetical protein
MYIQRRVDLVRVDPGFRMLAARRPTMFTAARTGSSMYAAGRQTFSWGSWDYFLKVCYLGRYKRVCPPRSSCIMPEEQSEQNRGVLQPFEHHEADMRLQLWAVSWKRTKTHKDTGITSLSR